MLLYWVGLCQINTARAITKGNLNWEIVPTIISLWETL